MLFGSAKKLAAGWCQWVALPQREPFTEWWRHQTVGTDYLAYWTHCCFGSVLWFGILSRSLPLPSPPLARRNGAETYFFRRPGHHLFDCLCEVLRATAGTQPLVEGVFLTPRV
ncbi:hypothetical protein D4764_03G0007840 [Takifugu flavidus]|uniref:Uncharacterized protein n=1 Tax=Takifugu flavidus TaxID=433684 RepID=A0A5C6N946_9TELE|nr:hypothetical protein D4764_03G0007840 [Takifugu flavidus]